MKYIAGAPPKADTERKAYIEAQQLAGGRVCIVVHDDAGRSAPLFTIRPDAPVVCYHLPAWVVELMGTASLTIHGVLQFTTCSKCEQHA